MGFLLDCAYLLACVLVSPWILYRLLLAPGRRDFARRFGLGLPAPRERSIWLHASSVGEITLLKPLVALLERERPGTPLVISAFTSTGLATARKLYTRHTVLPLPFDLSFVVRRTLERFDPRLVIIAESELWPNFIRISHRRGAAVAIVNGKMSAKSQRAHARRGLITRVLADVDLFAPVDGAVGQFPAQPRVPAELRALQLADLVLGGRGQREEPPRQAQHLVGQLDRDAMADEVEEPVVMGGGTQRGTKRVWVCVRAVEIEYRQHPRRLSCQEPGSSVTQRDRGRNRAPPRPPRGSAV